jgi:hypothetical protein
MKKIIQGVDAAELTVEGIRKRAAAFNAQFEANGGYKSYEAQAVDVLLKELDALKQYNQTLERSNQRLRYKLDAKP